jgi:hypothetical protein
MASPVFRVAGVARRLPVALHATVLTPDARAPPVM